MSNKNKATDRIPAREAELATAPCSGSHTPGPWKVDEAEDLPLAVIRNNEDGEGICGEFGPRTPEHIANARLVAAAPEMFESLIAIWARLTGEFDNPALVAYGPLSSDSKDDVIDIARKAIAKAEGK